VKNLLVVFHAFHRPAFPQLCGSITVSLLSFVFPLCAEPVKLGYRFQDVRPIRNAVQQHFPQPRILRAHRCDARHGPWRQSPRRSRPRFPYRLYLVGLPVFAMSN
jgi:hypothetical protein